MSKGPNIFLSRLVQNSRLLEDAEIIVPSADCMKLVREVRSKNKIVIARLDGLFFYDFSHENFANFFKSRHPEFKRFFPNLNLPQLLINIVNRKLNSYLNRYIRDLMGEADGYIFQSQLGVDLYKMFLPTSNSVPTRIIHNGVDIRIFNPNSTEHLKGFPAIIISASPFRLNKRLLGAIQITNALSKIYPEVCLHVLGEPDLLTKESISALSLDRCEFHGRINPSDLPKFYASADIQLSLCLFDNCPNVVCEGLACGLPIISPKESGAAELIGQENQSWLVEEGVNLDYLSHHSILPMTNYLVERYCVKIVAILQNLKVEKENARNAAVRRLDINKIRAQYECFIEEVLAIKRSRIILNANHK